MCPGLGTPNIDAVVAAGDALSGTIAVVAVSGATAAQVGNAIVLSAPTAVTQEEYDAGSSGAAKTIDWANGLSQKLTLTADCLISMTGMTVGSVYRLRLIQPVARTYTASFQDTTRFPSNLPAFDPVPNGQALYEFYYTGSAQMLGRMIDQSLPLPWATLSSTGSFSGGGVAIDSRNQLVAWGSNNNGQLGLSNTTAQTSAVSALGNTSWKKVVTTGGPGSSGIRADTGLIFSVGNGSTMGDNTTTAKSFWAQIAGGRSFYDVEARDSAVVYAIENPTRLLYAWGTGTSGQLGDNTTTTKSSPVLVVGGRSWAQVSAGSNFATAIEYGTGRVYAWGAGTGGRLGDDSTTNKSSPVSVAFTNSIIQISSGTHTLAIDGATGRVWAWGTNSSRQLGDDTNTARSSPVLAVAVTQSFVQVATTNASSFGLTEDGVIWAWGGNIAGQCATGNNNPQTVSTAVTINTTRRFSQIRGGGVTQDTMCAVEKDTQIVFFWGATNSNGAASNSMVWSMAGQSPYFYTIQNTGVSRSFSKLRPNNTCVLALEAPTNIVWAWSLNLSEALLGHENKGILPAPVSLALGGRSFTDMVGCNMGGGVAARSQVIALIEHGTGLVWTTLGLNPAYNPALGRTDTPASSFQTVNIAASFTQIAGGQDCFYAIQAGTGNIYVWGTASNGMLGDNSTTTKSVPTPLARTASYSKVAGGVAQGAAIDASNGSCWTWGTGTSGGLGNNSTTHQSSPVSVFGGHSFTDVVCNQGTNSMLGLRGDGTAWAWGAGGSGQLGDGSATDKSTPISVFGGRSYSQIAAGHTAFYAIDGATGYVWGWGFSQVGEVPDGSQGAKTTPVQITTTSFTRIAGLYQCFLGIEADTGILWAGGALNQAAFGDGRANWWMTPVSIGRLFS